MKKKNSYFFHYSTFWCKKSCNIFSMTDSGGKMMPCKGHRETTALSWELGRWTLKLCCGFGLLLRLWVMLAGGWSVPSFTLTNTFLLSSRWGTHPTLQPKHNPSLYKCLQAKVSSLTLGTFNTDFCGNCEGAELYSSAHESRHHILNKRHEGKMSVGHQKIAW